MLTMTRLPSDSFLPSGAIESFDHAMTSVSHLNGHSSSIISPLSLPRSINQISYFDPDLGKLPLPNYNHTPSLPGAPSSRQYLSPDHTNLQPTRNPRSSSLSPTRRPMGSAITSPSMAPANPGVISPFGHLSPQTTANLIQRREEHSRRILESWQAERAHLEASRARAEDMFREERALMDEERLIWADQKVKLEKEIIDWKQRTEAAESELAKLTNFLKNARSGASNNSRSLDGAIEGTGGCFRSGSPGSSGAGGLPAAKFRSPSDGLSPGSMPPGRGSTMPESKPFVPLDPRMQSLSPGNVSPSQEQERIPSIDINEVIPGLEGVRLRAPAIQKSTFTDGRSQSPTTVSGRGSPSTSNRGSPTGESKASPAEITKEALQAPEHHRLTMHAGHTPNHSMSFSQLPTVDSTVAPNTAGSSGTSTPTLPKEQDISQNIEERIQPQQPAESDPAQDSYTIADVRNDFNVGDEAILESSDEDLALKGPLCLKNRPAADEVFLRRLSDKLEEVKANDIRPSVLTELSLSESTLEPTNSKPSINTVDGGNDGSCDNAMEDIEEEIPLKLRKSNNFGQPLGQLRSTSGF
ncbi:hypothetical protein F5Y19DRAFT_185992 [Xylariaceae sp. FL1651]|nr:hypothetical protein F5Y19DRAFT_185992 [Xylariaceae sp. FL1651]